MLSNILSILQYDVGNFDIKWQGHFPFSPKRSLLCPMQLTHKKCLFYEMCGQNAVHMFMLCLGVVTAVHWLEIYFKKSHIKNEDMTQKHGGSSIFKMLLTCLYIFPVFLPALLQFQQFQWATFTFNNEIIDICIQLLGTFIVFICALSFIMVHVSMGKAWSPVPEALDEHTLVTSGSFKYARHPMYSTFAICLIPGAGLATLNWLAALMGFPIFIFFIVIRIPQEEAILKEIFHDDYLKYMEDVGSVGPKWLCFWEKKKYLKKNQ